MKRVLLSLFTVLALALPAAAQWTPDTVVVLKGKVVSMDTGIKSGQVVVRNGKVEAILSASAQPPAGAIVIDTKGYIYPGMMNLHNHLRYNFLKLYDVPRHSDNHDQWPTGKDYSQFVNNPAAIVTGSNLYDRLDEALKFAEVRALVGGETSLQGAEDNPAVKRSLVRNVELENFGEDVIGQRSLTIDKLFYEHLPDQLNKIKAQRAWIFHLCEGIDEYSRWEWSDPNFDRNKPFSASKSKRNRPGVVEADLVWPGLVGVHCTAMQGDDFKQWKAIAGSAPKLVWSPTSNLMLYGKTTDIRAAQQAGAIIALGTDWAPSGTKNLLWELKTADQLNKSTSPRMFRSDRQLVELVTTNPAKILGWEDRVGKIKRGFYADLIVLDKLHSSGYRNLIEAREENIQLVMVEGDPIYGDEAWLKQLKVYGGKPRYERIPETPDSRPKVIDMLQKPDERKGDMSLAEVRARLLEGTRLDAPVLANILNEGERVSSTKVDHGAREYVRADLLKQISRKKGLVARPGLDEEGSELTPDDVALYLELKYPYMKKIDELETIYTDKEFFDRLEKNIHWAQAGVDLRKYYPGDTSNKTGISSAVPGGKPSGTPGQ